MNEPFLDDQTKYTQFHQVNQLFKNIFDPEKFDIKKAIQLIKQFGGITSVMSLLQTSHREGLSIYADHSKRVQVFGENVQPKGESLLRKALSNQRDFTINLLLYFITLRFFIKLLFIRDGILVQSVWDEIVSFFLLIVMIFLKTMVYVQFLRMNQDQKNYYDDEWIKVKRDGQIVEIKQKLLVVGDIAIFKTDNAIRIDGLVLSCQQFYVSQSQTILKQEPKKKYSILNLKQNQQDQNFNPVVLSGSKVIYGEAEILVCQVGENCSFRQKNQKLQQFSTQVTPLIHNLRKVLVWVEKMSSILSFIFSSLFALYYLKSAISDKSLSWLTFLHILKKFSSLIGFVCLLQKLKIVRSLQFYLQSCQSEKYFRINNKSTLQKLNKADLFIIDKSAIKIHETQRGFVIPKINFLSYLNRYYQFKIVTKQSKQKIIEQFQISRQNQQRQDLFFQDIQTENSEIRLKKLKKCLFIPDCNPQKLQSDLFPIFEGLQYQIAYIYKFKSHQNNNKISKNIISFAFAEDPSEFSAGYKQGEYEQWVQIKKMSIAQDQIKQILMKSIKFCQLYNVYIVQFSNNVIIFFFLMCISTLRPYQIDFYWSLTIIIIARYMFFRIFRSIALDKSQPHHEVISHRKVLKMNIYLFFYYMYALSHLEEKINVVMFFVCNAVLRTEILLIKTQKALSIRNAIQNNFIVLIGLSAYILFKFLNDMPINQEFHLVQYVIGLSFLFIIYGFIF